MHEQFSGVISDVFPAGRSEPEQAAVDGHRREAECAAKVLVELLEPDEAALLATVHVLVDAQVVVVGVERGVAGSIRDQPPQAREFRAPRLLGRTPPVGRDPRAS